MYRIVRQKAHADLIILTSADYYPSSKKITIYIDCWAYNPFHNPVVNALMIIIGKPIVTDNVYTLKANVPIVDENVLPELLVHQKLTLEKVKNILAEMGYVNDFE